MNENDDDRPDNPRTMTYTIRYIQTPEGKDVNYRQGRWLEQRDAEMNARLMRSVGWVVQVEKAGWWRRGE